MLPDVGGVRGGGGPGTTGAGTRGRTEAHGRMHGQVLTSLAPAATLGCLMLVMTVLNKQFLSAENIGTLAVQSSIGLVLGVGLTFVILLGSIDLSLAGVAAASGVMCSLLVKRIGFAGFPVTLVVTGLGLGLFNGVMHARLRIPSFIVTLGTAGIGLGIALTISNATPINILGNERVYRMWVIGTTLGIPNICLVALAVLTIGWVLLRLTAFGRYVHAIGAGEAVARLSGVDVDRVKVWVFTLCGLCASLAGMMLAMRLSVGSNRSVEGGFLLNAIASVVVGGTALTGGVGGLFRTLIGVLIITVISNGMNIVGVSAFAQQIVMGIIVVVAVTATIDRTKIPIIK